MAGVVSVEVQKGMWAFVATPVRAIADLVYLRKEVSWEQDGLAFLTESMRIELDDLRQLSLGALEEVSTSIRSQRVRDYLSGLASEVQP
jgi:hypothetical protein